MFGKKLMAKAAKPMMLAGALAAIVAVKPAQAAVTTYNVTQTYNQVVYNNTGGWDTVFTGSFTFDSGTQTVTNLTGSINQAMTDAMGMPSTVSLNHKLSSVFDATLGGFLVSSFHQTTTDVFSNSGGVDNTVGFATGGTKEIPSGAGNQNAYVTIFFNPLDAFGALTSPQIASLAYGDCTTGSLMGMGMGAKTCMTGYINPATGLQGGTMMGTYPITQTITAAVPEPETYAMMMAGLGLLGFVVRRRRTK